MKINVVTQNQEVFNFTKILTDFGHTVVPINGQFTDCDVAIYDSEFYEQIQQVKNCLKIENITKEKVSNDFSISFLENGADHKINETCSLLGHGTYNEDLACDITANNQNAEAVMLLNPYLSLGHHIKIFGQQPLNLFCYCGALDEIMANDLYVSAKVTLCPTKQSLMRVLEAGGIPVTNVDIGLPEEYVFTDNLKDKVDYLLSNKGKDITSFRNDIIKKYNVYNEWTKILKQVGLNKISKQCEAYGNEKSKTAYF